MGITKTAIALSGLFAIGAYALAKGPVADAIQALVDENKLPGAVAIVATKDKVLEFEAIGFADIENRKPMKKNTIFWAASQSKPITAVAFMTLVEEGKASLDDPVSKYIPEFAEMKVKTPDGGIKKAANTILVKNLLNHTSGLPFTVPAESPSLDTLTLERRAQEYADTVLMFEPNTRASYSNAGINTIGRIIEIVSGKPYEQFLQERVLAPLGMKDTTFIPTKGQLKRLAKNYRINDAKDGFIEERLGQLGYPLDNPERQPMPAGGLFTTAGDMLKFSQMLANGGKYPGGRMLKPETVEMMTSKQTPDGIHECYGLGFYAEENQYGHWGAFHAGTFIYRNRDLITIWQFHCLFPGESEAARKTSEDAAFKLCEGAAN